MPEIKNLDKLAKRILKAIQNKERIILYADSDLDGTAAAIVVKEAILNLGGKTPVVYFSDRKSEEHGINKEAIELLKKEAPALFVSLDCGVADFEAIELAKKSGFDVAVLDHHEIPRKMPKIKIIVDPKQGKKSNPSYSLAASGLAFKLVELLMRGKFARVLREEMLGLVAMASLSDMVPDAGLNKEIFDEGLPLLESSQRPGIKVLFKSSVVENCQSTREIIDKISRIINITEKEGNLGALYLLLTAASEEEAQARFQKFLDQGTQRQAAITELVDALKSRFFPKKDEAIIFEGDENWPFKYMGSVASRTAVFFQKPAFVFHKDGLQNRGSFRMPDSGDGIKALSTCGKFIKEYGGHARAGGFSFEEKNSDKLKQCLTKYFQKKR